MKELGNGGRSKSAQLARLYITKRDDEPSMQRSVIQQEQLRVRTMHVVRARAASCTRQMFRNAAHTPRPMSASSRPWGKVRSM